MRKHLIDEVQYLQARFPEVLIPAGWDEVVLIVPEGDWRARDMDAASREVLKASQSFGHFSYFYEPYGGWIVQQG